MFVPQRLFKKIFAEEVKFKTSIITLCKSLFRGQGENCPVKIQCDQRSQSRRQEGGTQPPIVGRQSPDVWGRQA